MQSLIDSSLLELPSIGEGEDKTSPLKNRIRKNYRHLRKWAKRSMTNCFRIYDRDIKEYPLAIDFYAGRFCVQFFSYQGDELSPSLQEEVEQILKDLFGTPSHLVHWKTRAKRKKIEQYEKIHEKGESFTVFEYGVQFKVNLGDYLDTGLFLDHRETRQKVASLAKGKKVLNLFAYTCSFSVHAAMAGASFTQSVDLSNTYTLWGQDNFLLNSLSLENNRIIREDCLKFLDRETALFDVIVIDPPTLSRSKKMEQLFDIQIDYHALLSKSLHLLAPEGTIFFSTNCRSFAFDPSLFPSCRVQEITNQTIPLDFRNKKIHRCWKVCKSIE